MCAVCALYDYGRNQPLQMWSRETFDQFLLLVDAAKQFDLKTNQPDCEDPAKGAWLQEVKTQLNIGDDNVR